MTARFLERALVVCLASTALLAASVKVDVQRDKKANFAAFKTYEWLEAAPYVVAVDPDVLKDERLEKAALDGPIKAAVDQELTRLGLRPVTAGEQADLQVVYTAFMTVGANASVLGSYYQYTTGWAPKVYTNDGRQTASLEVFEKGTLVVDLVRRADRTAVWRGTATGAVKRENSQEKRLSIIRDAVKKMFSKYPRR